MNCPSCKKPMRTGSDGANRVFCCPVCGIVQDAMEAATTPKAGRERRTEAKTAISEGEERRSKYGNIKTEVDGIQFASKREARCYQSLKLREAAGEISDLKTQVSFSLYGKEGGMICRYVADFSYRENGAVVVADAKGNRHHKDSAYMMFRLKKKLMQDNYGIDVQEI